MTATLEAPATHPVAVCLAEVHRLLDVLDLAQAGAVVAGHAALVDRAERLIRRLEAVKLKLVASADRAEVAASTGMSGTGAWLAKHTHTTGSAAAGQVKLAAALDHGLGLTGAALAEGQFSTRHAAVIAHATRQLPAGLDAEQVSAVEARLVEQARTCDAEALRKKARRALEAVADQAEADRHHDRVLRDEEASARARTRLTPHENGDGTVSGHFTVPSYAGAMLRKTVQQLASPRRGRFGACAAQAAEQGDRIDWARRYREALVELIEHLPADRFTARSPPPSW